MKNNLDKSEKKILGNDFSGEDEMKNIWENYSELKKEFPKPDMNKVRENISDN